ncbi:hypothetical protein [Chryseosolibacter histidini]|uniref:hypothetical protein n=1 Tax=Chryseosolibacter histidini TaxID=2782349 RepID=UPI0020B264CD|nr:hypothetical protein [Chryseosolibacter histidini]
MSTDSSRPEKEAGEPGKGKKTPDPQLNRDINKQVQEERFPEATLSKNPRKDTEFQETKTRE